MNWDKPQRQSAIAIFVLAAMNLRHLYAIAIIFIAQFFKEKPSYKMQLALLGGMLVFMFGKAFFDYFFFTFHISNGQFIIKKGVFAKRTITIPLEKIQTVQFAQTFFHSLFGLHKVMVDTAGTETTEVSIQALTHAKAIALKEILTTASDVHFEETETIKPITLSFEGLMKMAISHNHLKTFGLIIAFAIARLEDVKDLFNYDGYDWLEQHGKEVTFSIKFAAIIAFMVMSISIITSVLMILFKYYDFKISLTPKGFNIKHGLLQVKQQFIPLTKIQLLQWNANWVRRKMNYFVCDLKTTGEEDLKQKQKVQVPVTNHDHLQQIINYYQPVQPSASDAANGIHPQYAIRKIIFSGLPALAVLIGVSFIWWKWYSLLWLIWFVYYIIIKHIYRRNFTFWVNEDAVEVTKGVWGRERILLNWHKIQLLTIKQSIYQRRKKLANLVMETAAGEVVLPYIKLEEAQLLADHLLMKIESSSKKWM
jgi:putative membrane protein